jgi:hypothetical protein
MKMKVKMKIKRGMKKDKMKREFLGCERTVVNFDD